METARRVACLTELGVTIYRRRENGELTAEQEIARHDDPEKSSGQRLAESVAGIEPSPPSKISGRETIHQPQAIVAELKTETQALSQEESTPTSTETTSRLEFTLRWWRCDRLLFVEADKHQSTQNPNKTRLMANIFRALGRNPQQVDADFLDWPIHRNAASREDAAELMTGFLAAQLEQFDGTQLCLMGEKVTELLLGNEMTFKEVRGARIKLLDGSLETYITDSLDEMLINPLAKMAVWRLLRGLRI